MGTMDGDDGGDPFDLNGPGDLPGLELESVRPPPRRGPPPGVAEIPAGPPPAAEEADDDGARQTRPADFDVLPAEVQTPLPTVEIAALSGYGPAPSFAGAIPYAILVFNRRRELIREAAVADEHRVRAEADVHQALSDLGAALARQADTHDGALGAVSSDLEAARAAADLIEQSRHAEHAAAGQRADARRAIDGELAQIRTELPPHEDLETKLHTQLEVRKVNLSRSQGQLQRAQIELRNARGAGDVSPEQLALLEATQERRQQEVTVEEQPVRELEGKLTDVRQKIAARLARIAQLEHDRAELDRSATRDAGNLLAGQDEAQREARRALGLLGRGALTAGVAAKSAPAAAQRATAADEELLRRRRLARISAAAIDAYDKPTLYQGLGVLGAAAIVVLVFVLVVLFRAIF